MDPEEVERQLAYALEHAEAGRTLEVLRIRALMQLAEQQRAANMLALAAQLNAGTAAISRLLRQEAAQIIGGRAAGMIPAPAE